jgi:hypothetical protein
MNVTGIKIPDSSVSMSIHLLFDPCPQSEIDHQIILVKRRN